MKAPHATSEILFESGVRVTKRGVWSNDFAFLRVLRRNILVRVEFVQNRASLVARTVVFARVTD